MSKETKRFGRKWERLAMEELQRRGYKVRHTADQGGADLHVSAPGSLRALTVEVKAAHCTQYGRPGRVGYQFLLFKAGRSKPITEHLTLLACVRRLRVDWFVVPSAELGQAHKFTIPQKEPVCYAGRLRPYHENWGLVAALIETII